jgi:hypothetical protein
MKTNTKSAAKATAKAAPAEVAEATQSREVTYGKVVAVQAAPYTQPPAFVRKKPVGS